MTQISLLVILNVIVGVVASLVVVVAVHGNRIGDLEARMTTFETIRIELVAPPSGGER